jgi:hypothetical protein
LKLRKTKKKKTEWNTPTKSLTMLHKVQIAFPNTTPTVLEYSGRKALLGDMEVS